nr:MAG TPA: hypothetical protein [Caudoviricetes sp.]
MWSPVWGFTLYKIDGITSYIKGFFLTPKPSNRRGIQVSPRLTLEITIFSNFLEVVSSLKIC